MNVFDVLREKLEEKKQEHLHDEKVMQEIGHNNLSSFCGAKAYSLDGAIEIVNQVEQEYNNGWIPCSERLPKDNQDVLIWHSSDNSISIDRFIGENIGFEHDVYNDVIAWQPLPPAYEQKGE